MFFHVWQVLTEGRDSEMPQFPTVLTMVSGNRWVLVMEFPRRGMHCGDQNQISVVKSNRLSLIASNLYFHLFSFNVWEAFPDHHTWQNPVTPDHFPALILCAAHINVTLSGSLRSFVSFCLPLERRLQQVMHFLFSTLVIFSKNPVSISWTTEWINEKNHRTYCSSMDIIISSFSKGIQTGFQMIAILEV